VADEESTVVPAAAEALVQAGIVSQWLAENGFNHESLAPDANGVEIIKVAADFFATYRYSSVCLRV
jgi:NAD(P)H-quinone oxidoreductase subunit J